MDALSPAAAAGKKETFGPTKRQRQRPSSTSKPAAAVATTAAATPKAAAMPKATAAPKAAATPTAAAAQKGTVTSKVADSGPTQQALPVPKQRPHRATMAVVIAAPEGGSPAPDGTPGRAPASGTPLAAAKLQGGTKRQRAKQLADKAAAEALEAEAIADAADAAEAAAAKTAAEAGTKSKAKPTAAAKASGPAKGKGMADTPANRANKSHQKKVAATVTTAPGGKGTASAAKIATPGAKGTVPAGKGATGVGGTSAAARKAAPADTSKAEPGPRRLIVKRSLAAGEATPPPLPPSTSRASGKRKR